MSKVIPLVFSLVGLFSVCVSQVIQDGQCTGLLIHADFDIQEFLGKWYEFARTDNPNQQGDCSAFELTDNNGLEVYHSSVNNNFFEEAKGTVSQDGNSARLQLTISLFQDPIDFWVRDTDYTTYAITFSCENISPTQRKLHIWVLTGQQEAPSPMALAFISTTILNTFGIEFSTLRTIDHSQATCYVLPVIEPGEPIIFPGLCDENLAVVQNFNVDRFLGLWHQISSYETPNGNGACVRAEYTRGDGVVNVLNSQVVDQRVLTIDGYATVSSTDAKLSVVLNIPGEPSTPRELWILRSDYDNYAIAYTCEDIGTNQRRVYSWILGRTRQLSPSSETAVNEAIRSYLDLNSIYYQPTDQSDAGCFFYPEPNDQPVVFRGQCESVNVQAMSDFEADRYMGTWHNIEMYPSRFQDGSCSNAFYELVDGNVAVVNSQVNGQRLETVKAVAVPASDGSAKLVVTFPVPGSDQTVSSDYWVLATDYSNYAFVYTCQNLDENEMQVGSWKLSKTKQLLPGSETSINAVMSTTPYLDYRYYKKVDQTEAGCFYFPEPQENVPVVFPGQCDETVGVVQNFNFANFEGTWYDIESYPKAERTGQCVNHQFNFVDNTRLDLVSSSVRDQFRGQLDGVVSRSSATDNSGKLTITIADVNGQAKNIPFWILATNYNDFAFAYACENIDTDFRAVWSWKLSKTRELSTAAITAINTAMANNVVLQDSYFEKIDHSDEACFYLPELVPGEPVILPGQCDSNIAGMSDFNIERYTGRWRLIESYGSDFQDGTCNVARYTQQASNILSVTNSQVVNEQLASISGTATISSTDESGQLTFNLGGEVFNVIILDTDYDSYSLSYSCVNLPDTNQRRVYSWKMSRENTLSQNAIDSINQIIDKIQVLNNHYYYHIDRTDTGCFYLPTPDPSSGVRFRGQCDQNLPVVTNFQPARYLGRWYDIESYPGDFQNGKCNTATYSEHPESGIDVDVYNTQVINEALFSIRGTAVQDPSTDGSAKLTVTFSVGGTTVSSNYWVLATDYDSYALVYSCRPIDDEYVQVTSWKLSKTRVLTSEARAEIDRVMSNIRVLEQRYFIERDHTPESCFYFPEPQPGVPVVFPGQCDNSIAAVPNFNMNNFQGTWHEIAGYPKANQGGQCISQQFTVNATNSMRLDSFSVLDLTQSSTEGHVTFARDDDLSGKLEINIWVNGEAQSIPYWILSTDYTDYALVYSCVNINKDYRGVWSWKLSKTRQLSVEGTAAINEAIAKVDVLRNDYYENIQQTDTACFHLPDITPGDNVVLPGQCDSSIGGMADFDIAKYSGEWRLIESYGSRYQSGTCNVARYTQQASNILSITNSQVVNEQLASISGTATLSSADGSGRLTFNMRNREYVMYILETDYDSFALAYGCTNSGNDQRRVTSWKFSRFNTLSQDATNRINQIINDIEVLHQPYYYQVDRSPDACFYFPEPDRNTPVRFRGQCDETISVVPDFDVEKYMGLWHDIESYPVVFQDGECPNARYAALDGNTASVYNTHVVDQRLGVIKGLATVASTDDSAKLKVTFDGQHPDAAFDYWVLSTDYTSYAFVYSCTNQDEDYMSVASWKLSKTKELTSEAKTEIDRVMSSIRALDQRYFVERDQTPEGCFYFPEPQPGVPVVFPGQCDDNIVAVPNFNMNDFQGTWHEIAGYPKANQGGQCISQQFTVNATNSMRLDSFSVLGLTQSSTEGHVTFARDDDLSGKLEINIWVNGEAQSIPYWILSTDYTDYALVYSCVNINKDYRGVWSWKLSKTRQLSVEGTAAINEAIAKVDVLRNDYYENIQQTDTACFHLPHITPGDNVVLPGQCDSSIGGMADFDIAKYSGEWRLIESYGSRYQSGTCNVARYTQQASNILSITNSQVVNEQLASISGTATMSSNDGSGRLTFNMRNREYVMYILETDYDSFALAYGCTNSGNDQRRVTSWKFSRFNTLSQDATNRINQIINDIEVLHQPYYYQVDRSPDACFYFPEPDRNTPVKFRGQCDETISVVPDFDVEKYMGLWHDIESYPVAFQDGECPNARYTALDGNTASVYNTHVVDQRLGVIKGLATVASTDDSAKLKVTFDGQHPDAAFDYWVLSTDYTSYAFVYSCTNQDEDYMSVASWKLSKTKELTSEAKTEIDRVMSSIRALDQRYFVERDQTPEGCFYFPEPQPGVPVVFPGQCDNSIAAVPNFNMNNFQGTWHEIAGYPKANQGGQCISQQFTVNATNSMRLDSFSVLGLTQSSTEGHVTFARDDDLSGKLEINIWVNGEAQSIPYWILSTDYTDYALVYSCVNINKDYRGVWSWKLSKTRQLSVEGTAAINEAIAKVDVLRNDYYENIQQTDTACFHLPDITPGDNVVLPGQCDSSIGGMADFDIAKYSGEWRLIESYGSRYQSGTCNVARYTQQASNILSITNSQVVNEQLASISGTATLSSADGSGRLTFNMRNREYVMYILETDYDSFALAYGCTNSGNDQRRVTSWKFSRFNTLSQDATNKINQIINDIEVLHQPYYYQVDRSPDACFYFPEPDKYTPVKFRGQCDETISVVPDFDVEKYMGLWHDIESYPVVFQDGECPNARYTALDGNTASVYNTHVVDQRLGVIKGLATVASTDDSAKLKVTFDGQHPDAAFDYWVLSTDYTSYAFVYSCTNQDEDYMSVASWKLSKTKELTSEAKTEIDRVMSSIRALDQRYFVERDQTPEGCFYFPEPQPGVPVVFPGQCDDNIVAVPNFNMNDFQGTWHEIAGYPKANQGGQCISQQFTVNATNSMRLDSLSVLGLTQSSTEGHVTFARDDDLSGKLEINIWVNGEAQSITYWILSTDYTDYALVYSCVTINKDYRGVWSWKLSKTRQLSVEGTAAINEAIAKVDVLRNDYYENIQQTDTACFHLPDITPGDNVVLPGQCDSSIRGMADFDIARYAGEWRLIESYGSRYQSGTCNVARYTQQASNILSITNSQVVNEQLASISGTATLSSADGSGRLTFNMRNREYVMYILETDYDSFALAYGCANSGNDQRRVTSWKFSRFNTLSQDATNRINQIINDIEVLHQPYYYQVDRSPEACFYFPEPDRNTPVRFRGQCDESIQVVPSFQAELYAGTWYDVESYPTNFHSGTCNTATFTANSDGTLDVKNTQVVDQLLQTVTGTAVRTTTDGSAKFDVTLTSSSGTAVTTKYWILATDYETYSFVYSCRNIDNEYREVYSWKLGKGEPTIPEPAVTTINTVIDRVQVLSQQYYVSRSHTNEACFYYPDNKGGDVIMKGQCILDAEVPVVPNFNANAFSGLWHEVSRFPSALQDGECTATEYALNGANSFDVIQTSVKDEENLRTVIQASVASDGRGVISINIDGVPFDNVYILDTDYTQYALAYSCRDLDADRKQLYSWKLSKSRAGLSDTANDAIDELVSSNIDLHESYYRKTRQDHAACFYYPVFDQGPLSIELPGPCNESITGIPNFNMLDYLGTWYEVARYPQTAQTGQCNRAEFTATPNSGTFNIVNSQVYDEALAKISGEATVIGNDGQIEVTFNVGGETRTAKYFVLATDYKSYALLYSCVTIESGARRRVGSWKLSRNTELSENANTTINAVIGTTQGLKQQYYQHTSHSDQACFHYPKQTGDRVIIPGQCDINISAVESFNVARFANNSWYQIKRYDAVGGSSCVGTRLSFDETTRNIEVLSFEVVEDALLTTEGSGQLKSNDGRGIFSLVTDDSEGGETTTTIYILATDYDGYALAYSCENINVNQRQVGAWQLSRGRTMTEAGNAAITDMIAERPELYEEYFKPISQPEECLEPSSAFLFKSSIILIFVCTVLQLVW